MIHPQSLSERSKRRKLDLYVVQRPRHQDRGSGRQIVAGIIGAALVASLCWWLVVAVTLYVRHAERRHAVREVGQ